jgi:hypothetical protein
MRKTFLSGQVIGASLILGIIPITALISLQKAALGSQPKCTVRANIPYRSGSKIFASASISCNRKVAVLLAKKLCLQAYRAGQWTNILCQGVSKSNTSSLDATISAGFFGESYRTELTDIAAFDNFQGYYLGKASSPPSR